MSSRPFIKPYPVIEDGDMSANIISDVTIITNQTMIAYAVSWVGTSPVGECKIEVSNDYAQNAAGVVVNPGNWITLDLSATATVSGNSDSGIIELSSLASYAIRLKYVRTSGTGTMQVIMTSKVQ